MKKYINCLREIKRKQLASGDSIKTITQRKKL